MIVVDIDGTIAKIGKRVEFLLDKPINWGKFYNSNWNDEPIKEIIDLVSEMYFSGKDIIFCTGRRESVRALTTKWIEKNFPSSFEYEALIMRPNKDTRSDLICKIEAFKKVGYKLENIDFVLEDRKSMVDTWRGLGVICLQVAEGDF